MIKLDSLKRKVTQEGQEKIRLSGYKQWINRAKEIHEDSFGYEKVYLSFKTQKNPDVVIYCKEHNNEFHVSPFNHIRNKSGGCKFCDEAQASKYFLEREFNKFKLFFDKHLAHRLIMHSSFNGMTQDMDFFCKIHNQISTHKPTYLMNSSTYGCSVCAREAQAKSARLVDADVFSELSKTLPEHIKIESVEFDEQTRSSRIKIHCDIHGSIFTTKGYLTRSPHKCPNCGKDSMGYAGNRLKTLVEKNSIGRATFIGVMSVEVFGIQSIKVGVTTRTLQDRYKWNLKTIHFSAQLHEIDAYVLENQIHRKFIKNHDLRILMAGMRSGERWAGDTECYWENKLDEITDFIREYLNEIEPRNYSAELQKFEVPNFFQRDTSRQKDDSNLPIAVVGINPITKEIVVEFSSISEATQAGFTNLSQIISGKSTRQISNGLRWFRKDNFELNQIAPIRSSKRGSPKQVICLDTSEEFESISIAAIILKNRGVKVSGAHISSVCKGKRRVAGGFKWAYKA